MTYPLLFTIACVTVTAAYAQNTASVDNRLEDGTPVKLRLQRTISSADAHLNETVDFDVLEEVKVNGTVVIPKGSIALGNRHGGPVQTENGAGRQTRYQHRFRPYGEWREGSAPAIRGPRASAVTGAVPDRPGQVELQFSIGTDANFDSYRVTIGHLGKMVFDRSGLQPKIVGRYRVLSVSLPLDFSGSREFEAAA